MIVLLFRCSILFTAFSSIHSQEHKPLIRLFNHLAISSLQPSQVEIQKTIETNRLKCKAEVYLSFLISFPLFFLLFYISLSFIHPLTQTLTYYLHVHLIVIVHPGVEAEEKAPHWHPTAPHINTQ